MKPNDIHDRESLSALYDGELSGEARLFALRRLAHDGSWKDDCGRWQLIGDAMRQQGPIAAPADLADRVRSAIAVEAPSLAPAPAVATVATPTRRPVRLWAGGALAASLALVAVVATRGPQPSPAPAPAQTGAVATTAAPAPVAASSTPVVEAPVVAAAALQDAPVVEAPTRVAAVELGPSRSAVARPARRIEAVDRVAPEPTAVTVAAFTPPDAANPFHVPADNALASRPWPRAALGTSATLAASYEAVAESSGDSPSFYPFEPRLHADATGQANTP